MKLKKNWHDDVMKKFKITKFKMKWNLNNLNSREVELKSIESKQY